MCKKVRNKEKLYLKIIDTSDENIKYHAMKNIIYRRKIMKMYYCYAGNKKAGDYFSCQMRNILMIFSFSATEKPRNTLSTSSFNWRSFSSRGGRSLPASGLRSQSAAFPAFLPFILSRCQNSFFSMADADKR